MNLHLITTKNFFIYSQLELEEALLRRDNRNWCILNEGTPKAIVLGISKKIQEDLLTLPTKIPVIRRCSGGGTVFVDENTLFISFLFSKQDLSLNTPEAIHRWMEDFYQRALQIPHFYLRENDYVIQDRKCGGNAQYLQKERWLYHTSFLWDYDLKEMDLLSIPQQAPSYRKNRGHKEFLTPLKQYFPSKEEFFCKIKKELKERFTIEEKEMASMQEVLRLPFRKSTHLLTKDSFSE